MNGKKRHTSDGGIGQCALLTAEVRFSEDNRSTYTRLARERAYADQLHLQSLQHGHGVSKRLRDSTVETKSGNSSYFYCTTSSDRETIGIYRSFAVFIFNFIFNKLTKISSEIRSILETLCRLFRSVHMNTLLSVRLFMLMSCYSFPTCQSYSYVMANVSYVYSRSKPRILYLLSSA